MTVSRKFGKFRTALWICVPAFLAACSTLPAFGPSSGDIVQAAQSESPRATEIVPYHLINVSAATLPAPPNRGGFFPASFRQQDFLVHNQSVRASDTLEVRIWETANDGLFAANGQRMAAFSTDVSNAETISLPYAGTMPVRGMTTEDIRKALLDRYTGQAIDPEISVRITGTDTQAVAVLGAVRQASSLKIPSRGIRLLDLLARAGGVPHPAWEVDLSVTRGGQVAQLSLDSLDDRQGNNIVILPGDTVQVTHTPRRYAVFGAVSHPGNTALDAPQPSLAMLLAEVGGLNDMQAEPNSVFVFRRSQPVGQAVAYRLDFARADAFLLADQFPLAASDIVYVATADASEFRKFVSTLVSPLLGSTNALQNIGN